MSKDQLNYLECHAIRHAWDEISVTKAPQFGVACDWRCTNCFGIKREIFSRMNGMLLSRYYKMPFDYRGPEGTTKSDYRKAYLDRKLKAQRKLHSA